MALDRVMHFGKKPRTELEAIHERYDGIKEWTPEMYAQWHAALRIGPIKPVHERIAEFNRNREWEREYGEIATDEDGPMYGDWDLPEDNERAREIARKVEQ